MSESVRVVQQDYHRNGIGGAGFVVSLVEWTGTESPTPHFVAVSFYGHDPDDPPKMRRALFIENTGVLQIDRLFAGDIGFGTNSWRGSDRCGEAIANAWQAKCRADGYDPFDDNWEKPA